MDSIQAAYNEVQLRMSLHEEACNCLAAKDQTRIGALKQIPFPNRGDFESLSPSRTKVEAARRVVDDRWQDVIGAVETYQRLTKIVSPTGVALRMGWKR